VSAAYDVSSETVSIPIPQKGEGPKLNPAIPARWNQQTKLDDSTAAWDFIRKLEKTAGVSVYAISITAESNDGMQNLDYSGALDCGYDAAALKSVAEKLQEIVSGGSVRMTVGAIGFPTGQALLDWLKATNQQFNLTKIIQ
jgi:hypothetical protein